MNKAVLALCGAAVFALGAVVESAAGGTYAAVSDSMTLTGNHVTAGVWSSDATIPAECGPASAYAGVVYGTDGTAVTAAPDAGYNFDHWSDNNSTSPTRQDTNVTGDITAQAVFVPETQLVFTIEPGNLIAGGSTVAEVSVTDASNRVVQSDSTTQVSLVDSLCGTTLATVTVNAGVAEFSGLSFRTVASGRHLHAISNPVLSSADSALFDVQSNPDWLFDSGFEACVP